MIGKKETQRTANEIYLELCRPFVKIIGTKTYVDHKWKPGSVSGDLLICFPYVDARHVSRRLNEVVGVDNWQFKIISEATAIVGELSVCFGEKWNVKTDVGSKQRTVEGKVKDKIEKDKSAVSDSLKRAAVHFGIGEYLWHIKPKYVKFIQKGNAKIPIDGNGTYLNGNKLNDYLNGMNEIAGLLFEMTKFEPGLKKSEAWLKMWNYYSNKK